MLLSRLASLRPRALRGSVFVEFWIFFILWLVLVGLSIQTAITLNRQVVLNYYTWAAGRAYMAQPSSDEGDSWAGYYQSYIRNFGIENRTYQLNTTFEHDDSLPSGYGSGIHGQEDFHQAFAGFIRMGFPFGWAGQRYPWEVEMHSWASTPMCEDDEEEDEDEQDNDRDDYGGYQAIVGTINQLVGYFNQIEGMF